MGGYVYYGKVFLELDGVYVYGDFVIGKLWGFCYDGECVIWKQELVDICLLIIIFVEDYGGELYIVDYGKFDDQMEGGMIYCLELDEVGEVNVDFLWTFSEIGFFLFMCGYKMVVGVIFYFINVEFWVDGVVVVCVVGILNCE